MNDGSENENGFIKAGKRQLALMEELHEYNRRKPRHKQLYLEDIQEKPDYIAIDDWFELLILIKKYNTNASSSKEGVFFEGAHGMDKERLKFQASADAKEVGKMFTRAREEKGVTKAQLNREAGIPRSNLAEFEKGAKSPTLERIQKYAEALGFEARVEFVPKDKS